MRKLPAHYPSLIPTSLLPSSRPHPTPRLPFYPSHLVHFSFPIFLVSDAWPLLACEICSLLYLSLFCFVQHLLFSVCLIIFHLRACCPETLGSPPLGICPFFVVVSPFLGFRWFGGYLVRRLFTLYPFLLYLTYL